MTIKPTHEEFELSEEGVTHKPTGHCFRPHPGDPGKGFIEAGHELEAREYNAEAVRAMAVRLWAQHLIKETRS